MSFTFFHIFHSYLKLGPQSGERPWFYFLVLLPNVLCQKLHHSLQALLTLLLSLLLHPGLVFTGRVASLHTRAHHRFLQSALWSIYLWPLVFLTWQATSWGPVILKKKNPSCWILGGRSLCSVTRALCLILCAGLFLTGSSPEPEHWWSTLRTSMGLQMPKWGGRHSGGLQARHSACSQLLPCV